MLFRQRICSWEYLTWYIKNLSLGITVLHQDVSLLEEEKSHKIKTKNPFTSLRIVVHAHKQSKNPAGIILDSFCKASGMIIKSDRIGKGRSVDVGFSCIPAYHCLSLHFA